MTHLELALCTGGMILGTFLPRVLPMTILAGRPLPEAARVWLGFVPAAVLAALVAPEIFLVDGRLALNTDNIFLLAALPSILVAWKTGRLFATLAAGMGAAALLRWGAA